jgi:hypothetical protein
MTLKITAVSPVLLIQSPCANSILAGRVEPMTESSGAPMAELAGEP